MAREIGVQSQIESYQRFKKWYLIPPCLTLSIIRYGSRPKWSNPGKGVALFPTPRYSSYWKGSLRVTLDYSRQLYLLIITLIVYLEESYARNICFTFSLFRELNLWEKSSNKSVTSRCFAGIISMIRRRVRIWAIVDRFLRKHFWFFLRIFWTLG